MPVRVRGLDALRGLLDDLSGPAWDKATVAAAVALAPSAAAHAPRLSGRLAGSVRARGRSVGSDQPYARVIHNGWAAHHIAAHPFILEAADQDDAWLQAFTDAIET